MKINTGIMLSSMAVAVALVITGCNRKPESRPGVGERTGAALDEAAKKGAEKAETVKENVKDAADKVVDKTGEVMENVGEAVDKAGENIQK